MKKMRIQKLDLKSNRAVTGVDIATSLLILILFAGMIANLVYQVYRMSAEVQMGASAMAYMTTIMEKVDEKSYDEITNQFVENLKAKNEIAISDRYQVTMEVSTIDSEEKADILKRVKVTIQYSLGGKPQEIQISKLKVKEMEE